MVDMTMKDIIILLRDTFTGKTHVDVAIKKFNSLIEHTEDFDHENRIYELEGSVKLLTKSINDLIEYFIKSNGEIKIDNEERDYLKLLKVEDVK